MNSCSDYASGSTFHPLDSQMLITFGQGHLIFWNRHKDGTFDKTDLVRNFHGLLASFCAGFVWGGILSVKKNIETLSILNLSLFPGLAPNIFLSVTTFIRMVKVLLFQVMKVLVSQNLMKSFVL